MQGNVAVDVDAITDMDFGVNGVNADLPKAAAIANCNPAIDESESSMAPLAVLANFQAAFGANRISAA